MTHAKRGMRAGAGTLPPSNVRRWIHSEYVIPVLEGARERRARPTVAAREAALQRYSLSSARRRRRRRPWYGAPG